MTLGKQPVGFDSPCTAYGRLPTTFPPTPAVMQKALAAWLIACPITGSPWRLVRGPGQQLPIGGAPVGHTAPGRKWEESEEAAWFK